MAGTCPHCGYQRPKDRAPIVHTYDGCIHRLKEQLSLTREELASVRKELERAEAALRYGRNFIIGCEGYEINYAVAVGMSNLFKRIDAALGFKESAKPEPQEKPE